MGNKKKDDRHSGKQKHASGVQKRKAVGTSPFKAKKKRLYRRTSSGNSNTGPPGPSRRRASPTMDAQSSRSRANINLDDDVEEALNSRSNEEVRNDTDDNDSSKEEDDEGGELTRYILRLPEARRYVAIGKAFTLKYWPWSDPNWWVDTDDAGGDGEEGPSVSDMEGRTQFLGYMLTLDIPESKWMTPLFRSSVTIPFHIPVGLNLTAFH